MKEITLKNRPQGSPTHDDFSLVEWQKPTLNAGEILVAVHSFSLDPYMRGRMDDAKSYAAPVSLGARMEAGGVGQVIESASDHFEIGDFVFGMTGWATHAVLNAKLVRKLDLPREHLTRALGVLGMPGFTGWYGLMTHGRPKAGETLVVAAASGPVGSMVGQLAKLRGLNVIGIAGSSEKCDIVVNELGFDHCLNHRSYDTVRDLRSDLAQLTPNGIDIYFENVAGMVLEAVMPLMNVHGRIPVCGMISWYNAGRLGGDADMATLSAPSLWRNILVNRLSVNGFIISDHWDQFSTFLQEVAPLLDAGKIKYKEDITEGIENAPEAFIGMLQGKNQGKTIIKVGP